MSGKDYGKAGYTTEQDSRKLNSYPEAKFNVMVKENQDIL